jgi:hypothetical protein
MLGRSEQENRKSLIDKALKAVGWSPIVLYVKGGKNPVVEEQDLDMTLFCRCSGLPKTSSILEENRKELLSDINAAMIS